MLPAAYCPPSTSLTLGAVMNGAVFERVSPAPRLIGQPAAGQANRLTLFTSFCGEAVFSVMLAPPLPVPPPPFSVTTVRRLAVIAPPAAWVTSLCDAEFEPSPAVTISTLPEPALTGALTVTAPTL